MGNVINYLKSGGGGDDELAKNLIERKEFTEEKPLIVPEGITEIGQSAFYGYVMLKSIILPDSVKEIGRYAFEGCDNLTSITIPDNVTKIGQNAFYYCNNLASITIPELVTSIGQNAFYYCNNLTSITIPELVASIGQSAFKICRSIKKVKYLGQAPKINYQTFYGCINIEVYDFRGCTTIPTLYNTAVLGHKANCQIVVPDTLYDTWQTATNWSSLTDVVWVKASEYVEATPVTTPDNV